MQLCCDDKSGKSEFGSNQAESGSKGEVKKAE